MWIIREPSWKVLEDDFIVNHIRSLPPSEERSELLMKWRQRNKINVDLKDEGISTAELQVRPDNNNFYIRPSRPFYEDNPLCKFSYATWKDKKNNFETTEGALQSLLALNFPNIIEIERGYGLQAPQRVVDRCNEKWHETLVEGIRAVVMEELVSDGEILSPKGVGSI